jgi:hypothetical protein
MNTGGKVKTEPSHFLMMTQRSTSLIGDAAPSFPQQEEIKSTTTNRESTNN